MNQLNFLFILAVFSLSACRENTTKNEENMEIKTSPQPVKSGYSEVNGLQMYYEIYGEGQPLVLVHGGGSTIASNFGKIIPLLSENRQVIAMELQAHGRTKDRNIPSSFEQDADDVATLLQNLRILRADFLGFSNGGTTVMQIAIRHPGMVRRMILGSALCKRNGVPEPFWEFMQNGTLADMPRQLKESFLKVNPDTTALQAMFERDSKRMMIFQDIPDDKIRSIQAPTLIIIGDKDIITPQHALEMRQWITASELAIIPGGHGDYLGEITTLGPDFKEQHLSVPLIEKFLDKK